jgi:CubicO group peptidase (beta-lactamase class C family)
MRREQLPARLRDGALLIVLTAMALFATAGPASAQAGAAEPAPLEGLDAWIRQGMLDWEVPGLAVAVVRDDSVVFARGYGVRELGGSDAVDEHTLFAIASTTKALTVAALGMLVDDGEMGWDDDVARHMPRFVLQDPYITRELTVRDLLTHRAGLSRSDNLWIAAPFNRAEILRRARHLPAEGFRAGYGYNNIMFIAAGELVEAVSGVTWDNFLSSRLFMPLGMTRSTTRTAEAESRPNVASSHTRSDGRVIVMNRRNYDNIGGAGAVWSTAHDMAQWLRLLLNEGEYDGQRLLRPQTVRAMHAPQVIIPSDTATERMFPATNFHAYGMGWRMQDYHARKVVHHSGSINFTRTHVAFVPAANIGVVAIANLSSSNLQQAIVYRVIDEALGLPARDWSGEFLEQWRRSDAASARRTRETTEARVAGTTPSLPVQEYAGRYTNEVFGEVHIEAAGGRLVLHYAPDYTADLEHWHHDTFRANWRRVGFGRAFVTFVLDSRARAASLNLEGFGTFERLSSQEQ